MDPSEDTLKNIILRDAEDRKESLKKQEQVVAILTEHMTVLANEVKTNKTDIQQIRDEQKEQSTKIQRVEDTQEVHSAEISKLKDEMKNLQAQGVQAGPVRANGGQRGPRKLSRKRRSKRKACPNCKKRLVNVKVHLEKMSCGKKRGRQPSSQPRNRQVAAFPTA